MLSEFVFFSENTILFMILVYLLGCATPIAILRTLAGNNEDRGLLSTILVFIGVLFLIVIAQFVFPISDFIIKS